MLRRQPQREQPSRRKCQTFTRRAKAGLGDSKLTGVQDSQLEMVCLLAASDYCSSGVNIPCPSEPHLHGNHQGWGKVPAPGREASAWS